MKQGKMSEPRLSGLNDEQDLGKKKNLKSSNHANPDADNMKQGWKESKLSCFVNDFLVPQRDKPKIFSGDIPWCRIEDFNGIYLSNSKTNQYVSQKTISEMGLKVYPVNTVIVSCSADLGKCAIIKRPLVTNQTFIGLVPSDNLDSKFFYYYMSSIAKKLNEMASGATIKYLSKKKFQDLVVCFPPRPEQQRIVSILDKAFAAIAKAKANAEQNLKNTKELFESYLQGVFENGDWETKKLSEVAKHSLGKMLDKNKNKGEPKEYLRNQNVRWFEFDLSDLNEMPFLENEKEKYTTIKGDVMICEGGYPGRAAIWEEDYPIYFQKAIHRVRFHDEEYNKWFLFYLFILDKTGELKNHFTGTGIQHFTGDALGKLILPFPPLDKVKAIVRQLDALRAETRKLEAVYQKKIDDLDELKKSILQRAFSGAFSY